MRWSSRLAQDRNMASAQLTEASMATKRSTKGSRKAIGNVRIIAGRWRHRQLSVVSRPGLRPTPDRVRETLFNWLSTDVQGATCVDLFAGTGVLGFEAASRGATKVILVERDPELVQHLRAQALALDAHMVEIVCADATKWLADAGEHFDLVFVDPPYGSLNLPELMSALCRHGRVGAASKVYAEVAADNDQPVFPQGWTLLRDKRAGRVRYYLATPADG